MIRVGRIRDTKNIEEKYPEYKNFTQIIIEKGSEYEELAIWKLKDNDNNYLENVWQFSKVYKEIPKVRLFTEISEENKTKSIMWEYKECILAPATKPTKEYYKWREMGASNKYSIKNPVEQLYNKHKYVIIKCEDGTFSKPINNKIARKKLYIPLYSEFVKRSELFKSLKTRLEKGENLLIIEKDGPHQTMLDSYKRQNKIKDNFIENDTIELTQEYLRILINDMKNEFGYGYCLALSLLEKDVEWNGDITYETLIGNKEKAKEQKELNRLRKEQRSISKKEDILEKPKEIKIRKKAKNRNRNVIVIDKSELEKHDIDIDIDDNEKKETQNKKMVKDIEITTKNFTKGEQDEVREIYQKFSDNNNKLVRSEDTLLKICEMIVCNRKRIRERNMKHIKHKK